MTTERRELLAKVNNLIDRRKKQLLDRLPSVYVIEDGIIRILDSHKEISLESRTTEVITISLNNNGIEDF